VVDQLLSEATIEQVVILQWIQVGGDSVERLEEVFLLELTEQEHLDGANLVTVSCNGHLLAVCIVNGDGFNLQLEVGRQFSKPHADEMNGGREERLQGLAGQLEVMQQSNKFNEQWLDDALGALLLFPLFQ
jgi:hypothetical protein